MSASNKILRPSYSSSKQVEEQVFPQIVEYLQHVGFQQIEKIPNGLPTEFKGKHNNRTAYVEIRVKKKGDGYSGFKIRLNKVNVLQKLSLLADVFILLFDEGQKSFAFFPFDEIANHPELCIFSKSRPQYWIALHWSEPLQKAVSDLSLALGEERRKVVDEAIRFASAKMTEFKEFHRQQSGKRIVVEADFSGVREKSSSSSF